MDQRTIRSLADLWPLQAALNARTGFGTAKLGEALNQAQGEDKESLGTMSDEEYRRLTAVLKDIVAGKYRYRGP